MRGPVRVRGARQDGHDRRPQRLLGESIARHAMSPKPEFSSEPSNPSPVSVTVATGKAENASVFALNTVWAAGYMGLGFRV